MTAKEYLIQIRKWQRQIESIQAQSDSYLQKLENELEVLYTQASGLKAIVYDKDRVQVSPENSLEQIVIRIEEVSERYSNAIAEQHTVTAGKIQSLQQNINAIADQIAGMDKPEHAEILRLRYVETDKHGRTLTLEQIACTIHRSYPYVKHLHGWALQAFQNKYLKS